MSTKEGILRQQPAGGWAIVAPGRSPVAILAGEVFDLEVAGEMKLARMERRRHVNGAEEWSTAQGYPLREGLRAGFLDRRWWYAPPKR
jgi:hypothetical protein